MIDHDLVSGAIERGTRQAGKSHGFDEAHDPSSPADFWFQESHEGTVLFAVFYTQGCRWSRCLGCNLPSRMSTRPVSYRSLMAQIDRLLAEEAVQARRLEIRKVIASNNGSILDQATFSSTALMYLTARLNMELPNLAVLSIESRPEYVEPAELEFLARALREGNTPTDLEVSVGFEAFDERIRNEVFDKGLPLAAFERLAANLARHRFHLKCYFMQKPVPGMSDEEAVSDIEAAIDYLSRIAGELDLRVNMHLNPTYVARGTRLEEAFATGRYRPPALKDVARAALRARGRPLSVFVGLSDEGLAVPGGSFRLPGDETVFEALERFNRTQDFSVLERLG